MFSFRKTPYGAFAVLDWNDWLEPEDSKRKAKKKARQTRSKDQLSVFPSVVLSDRTVRLALVTFDASKYEPDHGDIREAFETAGAETYAFDSIADLIVELPGLVECYVKGTWEALLEQGFVNIERS